MSIEVINLPSIKRLAIAGGAQRVSETLAHPVRTIIGDITYEVFRKCVIVAEDAKRKTLMYSDLEYVVKGLGERLYGSADTEFELCKNLKDVQAGKVKKNPCLYIGRAHFRKLVSGFGEEMRLSAGFLDNFQHYIENKIIKYLAVAVQLATANKKVTVGGEEINFVYKQNCSGDQFKGYGNIPKKSAKSPKKTRKSPKKVTKAVRKIVKGKSPKKSAKK